MSMRIQHLGTSCRLDVAILKAMCLAPLQRLCKALWIIHPHLDIDMGIGMRRACTTRRWKALAKAVILDTGASIQ